MSTTPYVTHPQLAQLVEIIDRRMAAFERGLNRVLVVLGTAQVLALALLLLVLYRAGSWSCTG